MNAVAWEIIKVMAVLLGLAIVIFIHDAGLYVAPPVWMTARFTAA
jgi:hypothetical protein